ncbi:MAG: adenylate/guanylate cyclase domain-containing protein [Cyanobacteriota bacterium]
MNGNTDEEMLKSTMSRYMTPELAEELLNLEEPKLGGECKEVSILLSDIRGYTTIVENLEDEEVVALLNDYFESMVEAIFQYQGTVDKYINDSIQAVFGSPFLLENHAWCAVQTAIEMCQRLAEFNASRLTQNQIPIRIGIGINSDRVFCGNIGSSKRMEFTVIGTGVNLAVALTDASRYYGCDILISDTTYRSCADQIRVRELDRVRLNGINRPMTIYDVVGLRSEPISKEKQQLIEHYHKGREYYLNRKFRRAMNVFGTILEELDRNDKAASLYFKRCQHFLQEPPPEEWDGIWTLPEK